MVSSQAKDPNIWADRALILRQDVSIAQEAAHLKVAIAASLEKCRLLNCILSNSSWKEGKLTAQFRQPFDMLVVAKKGAEAAAVALDPEKGILRFGSPKTVASNNLLHNLGA